MRKRRQIIARVFYIAFIALFGYLMVSLAGYLDKNRPQLLEHSWQGYIDWADNLATYGDYDLAVKAAETAISKDTENAEGYIFLADIHMRNRDYSSAKAVYTDAIAKLGETDELAASLADIDNVVFEDIDASKSKAETKTKEDTFKYDLTKKYNSNGDIVYAYSRSRDWQRPDLEEFYEYNSDNQLLRITKLSNFELPGYTTYQYDAEGDVLAECICDYDGFMLSKTVFDKQGVKTTRETHSKDRSYYVETLGQDEYVLKKDFYNEAGQLMYYAENVPSQEDVYSETTTYYNTDGTVKYIILHQYNSAVKSVERETYFYADGSIAYMVDHGKDKAYYLYSGDAEEFVKGNEMESSKFYTDIDPIVYELLEIKK